jgi:hypothetical protein
MEQDGSGSPGSRAARWSPRSKRSESSAGRGQRRLLACDRLPAVASLPRGRMGGVTRPTLDSQATATAARA